MTTIRAFTCNDLLRFNNVNLDPLTETVSSALTCSLHCSRRRQYNLPFYFQYLARWPEYFAFAEGPGGACQGYSAGTSRPALLLR